MSQYLACLARSLLTTMPTKFYNPSGIAAAFISSDKSLVDARQAGARATLRYGVHLSDPFSTRTKGGLHSLYTNIHGRGGQTKIELEEINKLINNSLLDTFDAVSLANAIPSTLPDVAKITALDGTDGGISLFLHCPGYKTPPNIAVDDITVDLYISPRELAEGGTERSRVIAQAVQSFGEELALPHLCKFQLRCKEEGVKPLAAPGAPVAVWTTTVY
jgi:hypothetical protein